MTATTKLEKPWVTNTNCSKLKAFWYQHEEGGGVASCKALAGDSAVLHSEPCGMGFRHMGSARPACLPDLHVLLWQVSGHVSCYL